MDRDIELYDKVEDWDLPSIHTQPGETKWRNLSRPEKVKSLAIGGLKLAGVLCCLYLFICSLDFMSSALMLLGAKTAGKAFSQSRFLNNPITALMLGMLAAALLHNSAMVVSINIALVANRIIQIPQAIPIIMGADVGTAITNIMVSIIGGEGGTGADRDRRNQFKRAFAAATIHDMFNWLSVVVFLPLEIMTGFLYHFSNYIVSKLNIDRANYHQKKMVHQITKPLTDLFLELDDKSLDAISRNLPGSRNLTIMKRYCSPNKNSFSHVSLNHQSISPALNPGHRCNSLFARTNWSDNAIGAVMLVVSFCMLALGLIGMVKILLSIIKTKMSQHIRRVVNYQLPRPFTWFTGYLGIVFGALVTFLIQSSTIFTSTLTPLVGIGLITLENVYPLTLGSNLGTTATGIIASLTVSGIDSPAQFTSASRNTSATLRPYKFNRPTPGSLTPLGPHNSFRASVQMALIHTIYNALGIVLFYPIPFLRLPLFIAKFLGAICYKYRWFSIVYLAIFYIIFPLITFSLSALGGFNLVLGAFVVPLIVILATVLIIGRLQTNRPDWLPPFLKTWDFLPEWLRSLAPMDRLITRMTGVCCRNRIRRLTQANPSGTDYINTNANPNFEQHLPLNHKRDTNLNPKIFEAHNYGNGPHETKNENGESVPLTNSNEPNVITLNTNTTM